ncbi:MAG: hypothetical protein U0Q15_11120 [Kineosporiaceae bacterium]
MSEAPWPPRDPATTGTTPPVTGSMPVVDPGRSTPPRRLLRGADRLAGLVGKRLLVGVTFVDEAGTVLDRQQFCGEVLEVAEGVVVVERPGWDEPALIPADEEAFRPADPGTYRLHGTGEVVVNPDVLTTWTVLVSDGED